MNKITKILAILSGVFALIGAVLRIRDAFRRDKDAEEFGAYTEDDLPY